MSVHWDEESVPDIARIEVRERTVMEWVKALRVVRAELWERANRPVERGKPHKEVAVRGEAVDPKALMASYSALAHLSDVLLEAVGKGRE